MTHPSFNEAEIIEQGREYGDSQRLRVAELERSLRQSKEREDTACKELSTLLYAVSHDLRAPLRHILGFSNLLGGEEGSSLSGHDREFVGHIVGAARQMERLIDGFLKLSRLGKAELVLTALDPRELCCRIMDDLAAQTEGRKITWTVGPMPVLSADASLLRDMFVQLLDNALKFTTGRAVPEIEVGCASESAAEAVLFVRDNGIGFETRDAEKIFGAFA